MEPKGDSITLRLGEVERIRSLSADARLAAVDGLFDWLLGREVVRGGVAGEAIDALVARQERHLALCRARAAAGRRGGLAGLGIMRGIGNRNAGKRKQNESKIVAEETKAKTKAKTEAKTKAKTKAKSNAIRSEKPQSSIGVGDFGDPEIESKNESKTQSKNESKIAVKTHENHAETETQGKAPPFAPSPLPPLVPPCTSTPYNPPSGVGYLECGGPTGHSREGARTRGGDAAAAEAGGGAVEFPSAPEGRPAYLPDEGLQRCYAAQIGVPADYLATFMAEMEQNGWGYVNRGGAFVQLNRQNFKYVLGAFWRQHRRRGGKAAQPQGVSLDALEGFDFSRFGE